MNRTILHLAVGMLIAAPLCSQQLLSQPQTQPLEKYLNPEGTIKLDPAVNGSLDVRDWSMNTDVDGTPRFIRKGSGSPAGTGDEFWDGQFKFPGANNYVLA